MKIHLLAQAATNPVLTAVMEELATRHDVSVYDAETLPEGYGSGPGLVQPPDVVLLKSRSPEARQVARTAERAGSLVVNPPAATTTALDRAATAGALDRAGVPQPRTWSFPALRALAADAATLPWPLVVKSRTSSRRDLVRLVPGPTELPGLLPEWADEPVIAQAFVDNDGFDIKVWVIGDDLSAARRRSALESIDKTADEHLDPADLPEEWIRAARDAGAALGLQLYGVDLLITGGRPVVVDINPFPGFRGARGPAESLLRFLSTIVAARTVDDMTHQARPGPARPRVNGATEALDAYLARQGTDRVRPPLRYLRRKPARGLVAVFGPGKAGDIYTVTVDERTLLEGADDAVLSGSTVQAFPVDPKLPHLDAVMAPADRPDLAAALESTARAVHDVPPDRPLLAVAAEPVRYKPGDRCVLRYRLRFGRADGDGATRTCTLVAKLYGERSEAQAADDLLVRLRDEAGVGWIARPLGVVHDLPLALTEDLGSSRDPVPALSGLHVVRPGSPAAFDVVRRAARALAELHTSGLDTGELSRRAGPEEAEKAAKRVRLLEQYVPALIPQSRPITDALCATLEALPTDTLRPGHGSYKASQLMVREGDVFLVDFDQFCLADPALDVGYFLAYLRPAGLWYRRAGRRAWFEAAAEAFVATYLDRLAERGETAGTREGIAGRAHVFEAALLLKIAARRVNRLHSPRPGEVAAVLDEVAHCLALAEPPGTSVGVPQPARFSTLSVPSRRLLT